MQYEIKSRYTGEVIYTADIPDNTPSGLECRVALEKATANNAYLNGANLNGANLNGANLNGANLRDANLRDAYLSGAYLRYANLSGAYLSGAYLNGANLSDANLSDANLSDANLSGANLRDANLRDAKNADYAIAQTRILPEGSLIGWKKLHNGVIAKLLIPEYAQRSHAFGRKCRAEFAEVLELFGAEVGYSTHDSTFAYKAGDVVKPHEWNENWQNECSGGIHFFITRIEAENYI